MFKTMFVISFTLFMIGCKGEQVVRPPKPNRFVVTRHQAAEGPSLYTFQDTVTGKYFIALNQGGLLETHPTVCQ